MDSDEQTLNEPVTSPASTVEQTATKALNDTSSEDIHHAVRASLASSLPVIFGQFAQLITTQGAQTELKLNQLLSRIGQLDARLDRVEYALISVEARVEGEFRALSEHVYSGINSVQAGKYAEENALIAQGFEAIADRLEAMGDSVVSNKVTKVTPAVEEGKLAVLASRLEAVSLMLGDSNKPVSNATLATSTATAVNAPSAAALDTLSARIAAIDIKLSMPSPAMSSPAIDSISFRVNQISDRLATLETHVTHPKPTLAPPTVEVLSKLSHLETQINALPAIYMNTFSSSLKKHTTSLIATFDDILKEQSATILEATTGNSSTSSTPVPAEPKRTRISMSLPSLPSLPSVPDMGISKRWSKLTGFSLNRPLSPASPPSTPPHTPTAGSSPLVKEIFEVYAVYPFKAEYEDELEMEAGDVVLVDATSGRNGDHSMNNGWWHAKAHDGRMGWIPSNYVKR